MPRVIIAIDGLMTREVLLTKEYTSVGRRPYNDIVIDNLAVSGEHAVLHLQGGEVAIEDLGSTNGTYVNGKPVRRSPLRHGDTVQVGKYTLRLLEDNNPTPLRPSAMAPLPEPLPTASVRVLSGAAAGRAIVLQKVVTTLGKPGVAVASITRRSQGFMLAHVDGSEAPRLNGTPIGSAPVLLRSGDQLELADTKMVFEQR